MCQCKYMLLCRNTPANQGMVSRITAREMVNFTMNFTHNPKSPMPPWAGCQINDKLFDKLRPMQEVIGCAVPVLVIA